jgi:hypothetical protein
MNQNIKLTKMIGRFFKGLVDFIIISHITHLNKIYPQFLRQRHDPFLQLRNAVTKANLRAMLMQSLGNAPGNGIFVGHPKNKCFLPF